MSAEHRSKEQCNPIYIFYLVNKYTALFIVENPGILYFYIQM